MKAPRKGRKAPTPSAAEPWNGETEFWFIVTEADVDALSRGKVPARLRAEMVEELRWIREGPSAFLRRA